MSGRRSALSSFDDDPSDHDKEDNVDSETEIDRDDEADPLPGTGDPAGFCFLVVKLSCTDEQITI